MLSGHIIDVITNVTDGEPVETGDLIAIGLFERLKMIFHQRVQFINWQHDAGISRNKNYVTGILPF